MEGRKSRTWLGLIPTGNSRITRLDGDDFEGRRFGGTQLAGLMKGLLPRCCQFPRGLLCYGRLSSPGDRLQSRVAERDF